MNAANIISLGRLLSVPATVWLILQGAWLPALILFALAGISDAIDGYLARHHGMMTELGGFLDPLADKALLVSVYIALNVQGVLPLWLVFLVVSRDLLIVGGVLLSLALELEIEIHPLLVSKLNTGAQIGLAAAALAHLALPGVPTELVDWGVWAVAATTILSGGSYLVQWARAQRPAE